MTAVMCLVVTGIGTLIHVYSVGYMAHDKSFARYFAYLNLFLFFMLLLVLGNNLLVLFVGWEGVGLASYLLIGFWFEDPEKTAAGVKAFIVNRVGDAGFVVAAFLIYIHAGSFDFQAINAYFSTQTPSPAVTTTIGLLLLLGACGKSAQIPLHVWLPDAMAGPTPVSALIHAATMVTAGVYLLARLNGLLPARARSDGGRRLDRRRDGTPRRDDGRHAIQPEEGARLLDDLADRLHGHGLRRRRVLGRAVPPHDARVLQGLPVPGRRRRPARAAGRGRHAQHGRPRAQAALHLRHVPGRQRWRCAESRRSQASSRRTRSSGRPGRRRAARRVVARRSRGLRAHRFLHVPRDLPHVLRHQSCRGAASGRRARATAFDVDRARRARRRLARRRVHRHARLPARAPRRLGAVLRLSRAAVPRGALPSITPRAPRSR